MDMFGQEIIYLIFGFFLLFKSFLQSQAYLEDIKNPQVLKKQATIEALMHI